MNRKKIMDLIVGTYNRLDPSGYNTDLIKAELKGMSDKQLKKYLEDICDPESHTNFRFYAKPYDRDEKSKLSIEKGANACKFLGVPLTERIHVPNIYKDENGVGVLSEPVFVAPIHMAVLQQLIKHEAHTVTEDDTSDALTGQVAGHSRGGKISNTTVGSWMVRENATPIIDEMFKFRSSNIEARNDMVNKIITDGSVSQNDIDSDVKNNRTLRYANEIMTGMMLGSEMEDYLK